MSNDNGVVYNSYFKEAISEFEDRMGTAMSAIGTKAVGYASKLCPVDTGRLRGSITYAHKRHNNFIYSYKDKAGNTFTESVGDVSEEYTVYIGSNVEYAEAVEAREGVVHEKGQAHFLRDAAAYHGDEYKKIFEAAMRAATGGIPQMSKI